MKKFILVTLHLLIGTYCFAQDKEVIYSTIGIIQPMPYYSYGKGLGFTSPDSLYKLNIRFRIQNRASFIHDDDGSDKIEAQIRRLRLRFDGYVGNPKFTYLFQLSFAPGDLGGSIKEGENLNVIRDAVVFYQPSKHWNIGFGQTKLPGNRQRFNSSGALQLTDRSINNATFNIDRDFGVQVHYLYPQQDRFSYRIKTAISTGEGRNVTDNADMHLAYTGKVEVLPLGVFKSSGEYFEGDVLREEKPKIMISAGYHFNHKTRNSQGQLGEALFSQRDLRAVFIDGIVKYQGWAFMTAYMSRDAHHPITINPENTTEIEYIPIGKGMDYQASYLFKNHYELIGRYSWQQMNQPIQELTPDLKQITLGVTRYIWEHAFKLQFETTYTLKDFYQSSSKENWYVRFQIEMGI
jgi:phosphate-selective porin OprO/OprP